MGSLAGRLVLRFVHLRDRISTLLYSKLIAGAFRQFGPGSRLVSPIHLVGVERISIGRGVYVGPGSALHCLPGQAGGPVAGLLSLGDGVKITGGCFIAAVQQVTIEANVLMGKNVHIADHMHKYSEVGVPVMHQGLDKIRPVVVQEGAWLGQGVVICPGVTVGKGAVIGANSVVNSDIDSYAVAVGSPARIVKRLTKS
jgi:acetyltransferase-like isoleucine patch superfamily enzyme